MLAAKQAYDELTPYDLQRKPRPIITDRKIWISVEALRGDLNCPICLSILRNTSMTLECSHRFCKPCIEQSLRMNSHDCPSCRKNVTTRRSLREDERFDKIIKAIYVNVTDFEAKEDKMLRAKKPDVEANKKAFETQKMTIDATSKKRSAPVSSSSSSKIASTTTTTSSSSSNIDPRKKRKLATSSIGVEEMLFTLRKHPLESLPPATRKEYIKAPQTFTVKHMIMFLLKQGKENYSQSDFSAVQAFQIVYNDSNGEEHPLDENDSLYEIVQKFKNGNIQADLVLRYKIIRS